MNKILPRQKHYAVELAPASSLRKKDDAALGAGMRKTHPE
jgi:hypothetical protein